MLSPTWLATWALLLLTENTLAITPGAVEVVGDTLVSAMMMFVGNEDKVYILDKVEGNPTTINGHPAYAAEWDIASNKARPMDMITNPFCASGSHLPNGTYATFGGNDAIGPNGTAGVNGTDATYLDWDGRKAIRFLKPCKAGDSIDSCNWIDNSTAMARARWYSSAEALADGSVVLVGGFKAGGFINRNFPNGWDPVNGGAENSYEFYPARDNFTPAIVPFLVKTSGLNSYPHMFLMKSGKMFMQANYSTTLWDYNTNQDTDLPDMPDQIVRVYPASGATAMLPLTPDNNYTQTILFCGGTYIPQDLWGNYSWPVGKCSLLNDSRGFPLTSNDVVNPWEIPAKKDCQRITPEPTDGSQPAYVQDDDMLEGRTMGQFIILPDGTMAVVNGGENGTAAYSDTTGMTPKGQNPFVWSLASLPVGRPAIYNPKAPSGQRWSNAGLGTSPIARLYHSSAILLPDASVLIAGSNPNVGYTPDVIFPTEYRAERFYPLYFGGVRPVPSGLPTTLSYGGSPFDVTVPRSSYSGDANAAAANTTVVLIRPGWTTHGMNMGQRFLQLNNTYSVADDGTITLHVAQVPPNPNLLTPGPLFTFVVVNGIPSNATMAILGNGNFGQQPTADASVLPDSQKTTASITGTGKGSGPSSSGGSGSPGSSSSGSGISTGVIIGIAAGGAVILIVIGSLIFCCARRKKNGAGQAKSIAPMAAGGAGATMGMGAVYSDANERRDSDAFIPLQQYNNSAWNVADSSASSAYNESHVDLHAQPYSDNLAQPSYGTREHRPSDVSYVDDYYDSQTPTPQHNPSQAGYQDAYHAGRAS